MTGRNRHRPDRAGPAHRPDIPAGRNGAFPIVGIGASAGGLEAFTELLSHLPRDTGLGFVLVQHLDPQRESALPQLLARATSMPVMEAAHEQRVEANHVYIIPPNANLSIDRGALKLQPRSQDRGANRSIDFFFESLAQDQRERAIGVVLSGTATDGTLGLEAIKAEAGITFAQDESAGYDSMPRSAVAAGCVDFVLAPEAIAHELVRIAKHPLVAGTARLPASPEDDRASATAHEDDGTPLPSGGRGAPPTGAESVRDEAATAPERSSDEGFRRILVLLRNHCGIDFSLYRSTTIQRRITRRMVLNRQDRLEEYASLLQGNVKELDALYSDVLISVTSFFRNPGAFAALKEMVFPALLEQPGEEPVRMWVLGCSTGQEAYSLAIAFVEAAEQAPRARKLQIFATDLNDALLEKARHGLYRKSLTEDISPERLSRFFVEEADGYRISKPMREMVVFARQNLISDPPFSRVDLISCRNLLTYLEPAVQKKAFATFHYALKPKGFLFLGATESISAASDLFEPADKKHRIFSRKAARPAAHPFDRRAGSRPDPQGQPPESPAVPAGQAPSLAAPLEPSAQREADRITVAQFGPPAVLVDAHGTVLQFRGSTSAYLEPPSGKASFDVLKMARDGLMQPLQAALNKARKTNTPVRKPGVRIARQDGTLTINLEVIPLTSLRQRCFLVLFEAVDRAHPATPETPPEEDSDPDRIAARDLDRSETRDYIQSLQEQYETAHEALQISNEEVQSANEELQSINEELQTSKAELESSNEELKQAQVNVADADERKNEFLAMLAHELRNPLAPLSNMLEIMRRAPGSPGLIEQARTTMARQVNHLARLVDDLLDVSRLNLGKMELRTQEVELAPLLRAVIDSARPAIEAAGLALTVELPAEPIYLNADPTRLTQVFGNLLHNGSKFTMPGGRIALTASRRGGEALVTVADTGIGIASERLAGVFELFSQGHAPIEWAPGGLGIGLALVKRLVEMHGGSVSVSSAGTDQGSRFEVTLPVSTQPPQTIGRSAVSVMGEPAASGVILLVDDNKDVRETLAMLLSISGYETHTATNGLEAVDVATRLHPDAVLLDIGLPVLNGYDACRRIRQHAPGRPVLIALTGWGQSEARQKSKEAGFDTHLVKPVDPEILLRVLGELLATRARFQSEQ